MKEININETPKLRRFVMSRPVKADPNDPEKFPKYRTIIYEISGVRRKMLELVEKWPPGDYILGVVIQVIIDNLIREGYKGKAELRIPWHTSHNILTYVMPRHQEPTKLYHAFYKPYEKAYQIAKENGIDFMEWGEYPPEHTKIKTYYPKFARTKKGQEPKLEKMPPVDNISEEPPKSKNKELMNKAMMMLKEHVENQAKSKKSNNG